MERIYTTSGVLNALGGLQGVAAITGYSSKAVWNWRKAKTFPSKTYATMIVALQARGFDAPATLWGMKMPSVGESA